MTMCSNLFGVSDAHTHILKHDAVVNRYPGDPMPQGYTYSVGIHPWHTADASPDQWQQLESLAARSDVVAIGETGLDKQTAVPFQVQLDAFRRHIALSERFSKPLIIHDVRAHQEILALHSALRPTQTWIIHGFRGKPALAQMFLSQGFYLSLGPRHNPDTLAAIPHDRLLRETDQI